GSCIFLEPECNLNFWGTAACDELFVLDCNADNTQGILKSAVNAVNYMLCAATQQDGYSFRVVTTCDKGHIVAANLPLFNKFCISEVFGSDLVHVGNQFAACCSGKLFHVALLNSAYSKDTCF